MEVLEALKLIRTTMDSVKVEGISNMDRLVGCANMLDTVIQIIESGAKEKENTDG